MNKNIIVIFASFLLLSTQNTFTRAIETNETEKNVPIIIACVGDSITQGFPNDVSNSYPRQLQRRFNDTRYKVRNTFVVVIFICV